MQLESLPESNTNACNPAPVRVLVPFKLYVLTSPASVSLSALVFRSLTRGAH